MEKCIDLHTIVLYSNPHIGETYFTIYAIEKFQATKYDMFADMGLGPVWEFIYFFWPKICFLLS